LLVHSQEVVRRLAPAKAVCDARLVGAVAQLGERLVRNEEVSGSIPLSSTKERIHCGIFNSSQSPQFVSLFVRNRLICKILHSRPPRPGATSFVLLAVLVATCDSGQRGPRYVSKPLEIETIVCHD
jgi:hypothetical protein